ncbi:MAG: glycerol-3-phosphate 1-O-acyltransferase PlsY [Actinobacteria bacterium]|nr:glycerol-3-phosphate 1-O-acyltransferase PlsY [Actinomycetota bacterium]
MGIDLFYKIIFIIAAYLFGAFPTAYVIHKIKKGDDIRKYGSGNVGGTNVTRTLGAGYGILTIIVDVIKGFTPILVLYFIYPQDLILLSIVSAAVILGHDFPAYIKFKGGKGIAASLGVVIGVSTLPFMDNPIWLKILPLIIILGTWAVIFAVFRIVSLASLCAAVVTPISFYFTRYAWPIVIAVLCLCILTFITHRENIKRLIKKEEKKLKR